MSSNIERLLSLQEYDRKIRKLTNEIDDLPNRRAQCKRRLEAEREAVEGIRKSLRHNEVQIHEREAEAEQLREKIRKYREQQFLIKSNEEYRALEHEIEQTEEMIRKTEDDELSLLESAEKLRLEIASHERTLRDTERSVEEDLNMLDERLQAIRTELSELQRERQSLSLKIQPDWLTRYERIMAHVHDVAIVPIENNACGGCHMKLPTQVVHDVHKGLDLVFCTYCGRILYWKG